MPRPDPALLDPARYPFHCSLATRFADVDLNQHVGNVAMVNLLQESRAQFQRSTGCHTMVDGSTVMVASLAVEFLGQSYFPDPLEMHVALSDLGRTSHTLHQLAAQRGQVVTYARTVLVCMNDHGPLALPASFRDGAQPWMLRT